MKRFQGKVVLITGAARGQGRAHALAFAAEGADIVALDICGQISSVPYEMATPAELEETAEGVAKAGARVLARACDVRSQTELEEAVKQASDELGPIDVLVANAGIFGLAPVWEITETAWADMMDVNLTGVWRSVKAVAPSMMERRGGSIVLTSSVNGAEAGVGFGHYVAAKHGVVGLMRSVALELGPYGIRCNAVMPGAVDTPMTDWQGMYDMIAG
ncbi:MAG: mycofactocin-coupled SDR family oxidoreductase, partial [Acidimicrobiales bacterium]